MNWDALGAMGEIVGALAVFATLAYLAIQIARILERFELPHWTPAYKQHLRLEVTYLKVKN